MLNLIIFILAVFGVTKIWTDEKIFKSLRNKLPKYPFSCSYCISVWVGFGLSFLFPIVFPIYINWFIYGCLGYTTTRFLTIITDKNEFRNDE